ncbi:hypothetical protein [Dactylosporangium fulvum]|uniref:Saccharopine dehydrogenase NADP binding domain-containing protein n=1 Tax=Dactylosporangium fulvum TaxID=53359 RepID=A0ABY5VT01_9ACTN|nr:hypothetical protein [Dactylosporangium fulvum]UWP79949.1 hypothetical protein Dfulv_32935 [Dactylosporangium fulvum]
MRKNTRRDRTLLIIGNGVLGGNVLDLLSWVGFDGQIVVGGRNRTAVEERVNLARLAAYNQGTNPRLAAACVDLDDVDRTAETVSRLRPDIIFNTASVQTYWRISLLPRELYQMLDRPGVGPWLPMHLSPAHRLMTAVHRSGHDSVVVNAAYPDAVNPALQTCGLAPAVGIGNVMNVVPAVRSAAALHLGVDVERVHVRLVAHHYVSNRLPAAGDTGGADYDLRIYVDGTDVTDSADTPALFRLLPTDVRRTRGRAGMYVTASSAFAVLNGLTSATPVTVHAPGPLGLVGGYPVRLSEHGIELDLASACSQERAVAVNEQGQVFDGIERIEVNGRVVFTDLATRTMSDVLGHHCPEFKVEDCHDWARELKAKYSAFEARTGVTGS